MGLLSFFKRAEGVAGVSAPSEPADAVQHARTRARQRLIGAAVLVVIGIVGFPLVFETQPRPIPVDIPIEVPRKEGAPPLVMPPARQPTPDTSIKAGTPDTPPPAAPNDVITESREEAGRELPPPGATASRPEPRAAERPPVSAAVEPAPRSEAKVDARPVARPDTGPATTTSDGARAKALLEGKSPAPAVAAASAAAQPGRFIVQVGAFADAGTAQETRLKVEKLGLKTYTQVAATPAGNRIRVRVGPFDSREDADKAMSRAKGAGLSAVVLVL